MKVIDGIILLNLASIESSQGKLIFFDTIFQKMDDYEYQRDTLKSNNAFTKVQSPKGSQKQKTGSTTSRSKQKQIITSFTRKGVLSPPNPKSHRSERPQQISIKQPSQMIIKKSNCQSEYFIKPILPEDNRSSMQFTDQIKLKQSQIQMLSIRLNQAESTIKNLNYELRVKKQKLEKIQEEMNSLLAKSLKHLETEQIGANLAYECQKYKHQLRRLLKMLEHTEQYQYFAKFALEDNGIQFLATQNQIKKSTIDFKDNKKMVHFCSCNKQYIPESNFWVPDKIHSFGKQFIRQRKGDLTISQFQLLLYELNSLWRERQKKIINSFKAQTIRQIQKYKRKINNNRSVQKPK